MSQKDQDIWHISILDLKGNRKDFDCTFDEYDPIGKFAEMTKIKENLHNEFVGVNKEGRVFDISYTPKPIKVGQWILRGKTRKMKNKKETYGADE